jgi:hypothetical protein
MKQATTTQFRAAIRRAMTMSGTTPGDSWVSRMTSDKNDNERIVAFSVFVYSTEHTDIVAATETLLNAKGLTASTYATAPTSKGMSYVRGQVMQAK